MLVWEISCEVDVRCDLMGLVVCAMPVMGLTSVSVALVVLRVGRLAAAERRAALVVAAVKFLVRTWLWVG